MLDDSTPAGPGHNNPPEDLPYDLAAFQPLEKRAREIADAGADWITLPKIETEEHSQQANDYLTQVRKIEKDVDAERRAQKKPHEDAGKAVDAAFKGLLDPLGKIAGPIKVKLLAYDDEQRRVKAAEKIRQAEEARKAEAEAERLKAQAEARGDVFGQAEAEAKAKDAAKMAKAAAKPVKTQIKSATGGGRTMSARTSYVATIDNPNKAFAWFRDHERYGQALRDLMVRMAEAERRSAEGVNEIPGITFTEERTIA